VIRQLGIDPHPIAARVAREHFEKGLLNLDIGENRRLIGQYPPETEPDLSLAHSDLEERTLRWLHEVFNRRMFGTIRTVYSPTVQWHGPLMKELYGQAAVLHQTLALVGSIPDCAYTPQHICSVPCEEGGDKVAVRWILEGHHIGHGLLGPPSGQRLQVMGMSHFHYKDGRIVDEWTVYDELSLLMQIKLGQMAERERGRAAAPS
jgi:predicted ester cyclase